MNETRREISSYLGSVSLFLLGALFLSFPLVFATASTDPFALPKQVVLGVAGMLALLVLLIQMINEGHIQLRKSPFDLPLLLFGLAALLSALFSLNRADAFIAVTPLIFGVIAYFAIVSAAKTENSVIFLLSCLIGGGVLVSGLATLSFFNVFVLPFAYTHLRVFTPLGSLLDQAIYLAGILPITGYFAYATLAPLFKTTRKKTTIDAKAVGFGIATIIIGIGLVVSIIDMTIQKPLILPFATGFQTAFAAISQDSAHIIKSFLLGSGFGTFLTDFTRFKAAAYNGNQALWSFTFFRSSTFVLELLATTGILGILTFLFLLFKVVKERPRKKEAFLGVFLSVATLLVIAFVLPFSFIPLTLLFFMLGIFAAIQGLVNQDRVYDVSLGLVAIRKNMGLFHGTKEERSFLSVLPVFLFVIFLALFSLISFFSVKYVISDLTFQNSLVAASKNNGLQTYQLQQSAIQTFPYRDAYYRIFSQTNIALANSLAASQPKGSSPSAQVQQTIYTLAQQSINAGRSSATISPLNALNWQNLSSIYRALIGFGANAENFAIAANQQAIALDSTNPQEYINLGGIYYQLGQWDNAILAFQQAVNLKPDLANAHYNLGHAFESKGDNQNALSQYQVVQQLVASDKTNSPKIAAEIKTLQDKIGNAQKAGATPQAATGNQQPLQVSTPTAQLPERHPPVTIPGPQTTQTPQK